MHAFTSVIMHWYAQNKRSLPWRDTQNAYIIWLSEVILQQTRVAQGLAYFQRFVQTFPTLQAFAQASEAEILKLWQGLGYYSRARNMHQAARQVCTQFNGVFPTDFYSLLSLKGIGRYTAAAISSFAANQAHAAVDGNVYRVLARYFDIDLPIDTSKGKKEFELLANNLLDKKRPGLYNQAMMEFGALQCIPGQPDCNNCPLQTSCGAKKAKTIGQRPVKSHKINTKKRFFNYLVLQYKDQLFFKKRLEKDIWQHLYDFPLIESESLLTQQQVCNLAINQQFIHPKQSLERQEPIIYKHVLTHQIIQAQFWIFRLQTQKLPLASEGFWLSKQAQTEYALPKLVENYLQETAKQSK